MSFISGVLLFFLIINCLVLILLVLVQLPKKDAGAGIAFGGGTADALFGAGSGNVLTKITKYATVALLVLCLLLGYIMDKAHHSTSAATFEKQVEQKQQQTPATSTAPKPLATTPPANGQFSTLSTATNVPAAK
jgi:preprotein translocase subunit SecG